MDPESILGVQLAFALGQVAVVMITKLYYPSIPFFSFLFSHFKDINIWSAVLRGLVLGRTVLMFTIQDEINRKIPLGKLRLF